MQSDTYLVLIDDDIDDQEIFHAACRSLDESIHLKVFENGESAINGLSLSITKPQCIFLDLNIPRMDGIEILVALKNIKSLNDVPVIIYTTYFDGPVRDKCLQLGAFAMIEKPDSFDQLCIKIASFLEALNESA